MVWTAELRFKPVLHGVDQLVCTATSDGKSPPRYEWAADLDPEARQLYACSLEEHYQRGLYGTGSIGEVRDMLHAMERCSQEQGGDVLVRAPVRTRRKAQREADAANAALPEGAVW